MLEPHLSGKVTGRMGQKRMWQAQKLGVNPLLWSLPLVLCTVRPFSVLAHSSSGLQYFKYKQSWWKLFGMLNGWLQSLFCGLLMMHLEKGTVHSIFRQLVRLKNKRITVKMCKWVFSPVQFCIVLFFDIPDLCHYLKENSRALPDPAPVEH